MPRLEQCQRCCGFLRRDSITCPHCSAQVGGRRPGNFALLRRSLASYLMPLLGAASLSVTLMACYGSSSYYDCNESGDCVEQCTFTSDCPSAFFCNDVKSCEPAGPCEQDADCPDEFVCIDSTLTCERGDRLPPGYCDSTFDCQGDQICDLATQQCVDPSCEQTGCLEGFQCDAISLVCEACPSEGCPLPACEVLPSESECSLREDCAAVYRGIDCHSPAGAECSEQVPCICDSFVFDACTPLEPALPPE